MPVKLVSEDLNPFYDSAAWEFLYEQGVPNKHWADLSNMYDGCAFE